MFHNIKRLHFLILLLLSIIFNSCSGRHLLSVKQEPVECEVVITSYNHEMLFYHLFFEGSSNQFDIATNIYSDNPETTVTLRPGLYTIYIYGMKEKSSEKVCVVEYGLYPETSILLNVNNRLQLDSSCVDPSGTIIHNDGNEYPLLQVPCIGLHSIFTLSSLSVKQADDRVRSVDALFNEVKNTWEAPIPVYQNGMWYMNISLSLRSYHNDTILEQSGYKLSTTYLQDIELGEFNFLSL